MDKDKFDEILLDIRKQAEVEFEKLILYIATGGLALTITFSEKIIRIDSSGNYINWLISTWICFAFTILISLIFHFTSIKAIDYHLKREMKSSNIWDNYTRNLRLLSIISLILGISSFIIYATFSITN